MAATGSRRGLRGRVGGPQLGLALPLLRRGAAYEALFSVSSSVKWDECLPVNCAESIVSYGTQTRKPNQRRQTAGYFVCYDRASDASHHPFHHLTRLWEAPRGRAPVLSGGV